MEESTCNFLLCLEVISRHVKWDKDSLVDQWLVIRGAACHSWGGLGQNIKLENSCGLFLYHLQTHGFGGLWPVGPRVTCEFKD